jgi:hypothetical protein
LRWRSGSPSLRWPGSAPAAPPSNDLRGGHRRRARSSAAR